MAIMIGFTSQSFLITSSVVFILFNFTTGDHGLQAKDALVSPISRAKVAPALTSRPVESGAGQAVAKPLVSTGIINASIKSDQKDLQTAAGGKVRLKQLIK